ncbi:urea ABC transporter permease subunit UrtB [Parendozoicomonas haliclonae]|uniref:High-affinity branched-chain amino acid transport system permease protein LivH n=1 Tax=Parendozoicomonas haliclonae TaxID=1960125 RepID=A0A1X7AJI5_9GAMM|nr:urea ABC transporter permease subunit UrtB [Parendozoicomonas haliclonae]SMA41672.1 High-affinity branched-chain amino acid transport system permease protein LivH [Parendozoicomonas haliclonae]
MKVLQRLAVLVMLCLPSLAQALPDDLGQQLLKGSWTEREQLASTLASSPDALSLKAAQLWLDGELFVLKSSKQLVLSVKEDKRYRVTDLVSGADLGLHKKRAIKKVPLNNKLRGLLRTTLSLQNLQSPNKDLRREAIENLLGDTSAESLALLNQVQQQEQNTDLQALIATGLAVDALESGTPQEQIKAAQQLGDSNHPVAAQALLAQQANTDDQALLAAINKSLADIEQRRRFYGAIENTFFGLSLGSVLLLSAIGLAITFGVMGVINMAHGEMIMLGAYTTFVVQSLLPDHIGASLFISLPLAFLVAGATGVLIERTVIRHLYGRPLETLLATFGVSLILQQAVRSIFSPLNQSVITPEWMSGSIVINEMLSLTVNRVVVIGFSLAVFLGLLFVLKYTRAGLSMRAVTQNRAMASSMGIRTGQVDALTFGLGSGIAGIAGVALSQLTNVGPNLGQNYIIDSFMVVVFGGVGNLWGTFVAAMGLGIVNKFIEPWAGAVIAKILVLVFIILFIQKRPRGLFALKGRAIES